MFTTLSLAICLFCVVLTQRYIFSWKKTCFTHDWVLNVLESHLILYELLGFYSYRTRAAVFAFLKQSSIPLAGIEPN